MKKTLVIVDFQKDFYSQKDGALYVSGAENCVKPICDKILNDQNIDEVVLTVDWHKFQDGSFEKNGGQWPVHCIQYSEGAMIHPDILKALESRGVNYSVFIKGNNPTHEEYGAFEYQILIGGGFAGFNNLHDSRCIFSERKAYEVCGLAGDYCVWETYKNMKKMKLDVTSFDDGIAWIGEPFNYEEKLKNEDN